MWEGAFPCEVCVLGERACTSGRGHILVGGGHVIAGGASLWEWACLPGMGVLLWEEVCSQSSGRDLVGGVLVSFKQGACH